MSSDRAARGRRSVSRAFAAALVVLLAAVTAGCGRRDPVGPASASDFGVLLMAHGGSDEWNSDVLNAAEPLRSEHPVEIAFGMADAVSIQESVRKLEARGVRRIGVVRLFVSGESWYERTEQILGLRAGAPSRPASRPTSSESCATTTQRSSSFVDRMELWRIETLSTFALSPEGLADAEEMETVIAARAIALSRDPSREDVLVLAHGPGDEAENLRWLQSLDARADGVRRALPFRRVQAMTLREDWRAHRIAAETHIRAFVRGASADGTAIVIPYRVSGFGPYREVLKDLDYVADGKGLLPHPEVARWIARQAAELLKGTFRAPLDRVKASVP